MNHDLIVPALEGGIPVLAGVVLMLLARAGVSKDPLTSTGHDGWHRRFIDRIRFVGPLLIVLGLVLGIRGFAQTDVPTNRGRAEWTRYQTSDGVCSVQLPGTPKQATRSAGGAESHLLRFSRPDAASYTLMSMNLATPASPLAREQLLDSIREKASDFGEHVGATYKFLGEQAITIDGIDGREIQFKVGGTNSLRFRVFLYRDHLYQVAAFNPLGAGDDVEARLFLDSIRFDTSKK